ncbi:MAG: PKD domain-containing protein [Sphingobacteriales bacterium]|nr:MAG: PKD domain-containing protein [Sphingobacteriales bacterium]
MKGHIFIACLLVLLLGSVGQVMASHIVGGELTYRCVGQNVYELRLDIYQDCLNGQDLARAQDTPAFITVFNLDDGTLFNDSISASSFSVVPPEFNNSCVNNAPPTCLTKVTFFKRYTLRPNQRGYRIAYVRCCRNAAINNILFPSETGATYFCDIPPASTASCNSGASFRNFPPQIICINNPLVYDHSASDADGDSLSYTFCESFEGGDNFNPKPFATTQFPRTVLYAPGYSSGRPISGTPALQINPTTGMISGTPNQLGRFVVTVCCNEWRNGELINTVKREFQFVVTNCSKAVVANIPQFSTEFNTYIVECRSQTVSFINQSTGGFAYKWDFGVPGGTSTEFQPTYTYPDTGVYIVKLVVNEGSTCPDSITRFVKVYPEYKADFEFSGLPCPNLPIQFTDLSSATYKPITGWLWNFGDEGISTEQNPTHSFAKGGVYNVALTSTSIRGCVDTARREVAIEDFKPFAGNDTVIVKGEKINFNATGGTEFIWTPSTYLDFSERSNPTGTYPDTGRFTYRVFIKSLKGCQGEDSIRIWVVNQPSLWVPNAFTPNKDGKNDLLRPISAGYTGIKYFRVFNRFGEMVFETNNFYDGWDGWYKGEMADIGTYFWVLSATNRFGQQELVKGDAILVR